MVRYKYWYTDVYRLYGRVNFSTVIRSFFKTAFRYMFWFRLNQRYGRNPLVRLLCKLVTSNFKRKYGNCIPIKAKIGKGLYMMHFTGIIINKGCVIGDNCTILQNVTLGGNINQKAFPKIGNNVVISAGAKIIGGVKIGDNAVIGANAVVTKDIPANAIAVGVPAKVISYEGSAGSIKNSLIA